MGLIGDIHGEDEKLAVVLDFLAQKDPDCLACAGDVADGGRDVNACCHLLESANVLTVWGNHDRWLFIGTSRDLPNATYPSDLDSQSLLYLSSLRLTIKLETESGKALLCHGIGKNDMATVKPCDEGDVLGSNTDLQGLIQDDHFTYILCGHSHMRMVRNFGKMTMINAGTLFCDRATFCYINFSEGIVWFYEMGSNKQIEEVSEVELGKGDWAS